MLLAVNFSGRAINIAKTNALHALSYLFTSKFKIPHGIAVSIFFIEIINLYYLNATKINNVKLIKKFEIFFKLIKQSNLKDFNRLFNKLLIKSGIQKYVNKKIKKIKYTNNNKFYFNLDRFKNAPIKILKKDINHFFLKKINI